MALIRVRDVVKEFPNRYGVTRVLDGVSFELERGDILAVVGRSGCGKTTLLNLLGGLDSPTAGEVFFNDCSLRGFSEKELAKYRNEKVGYLFQSYLLQLRRTSVENVVLPLLLAGKSLRDAFCLAHEALEQVGLAHIANQRVAELSGGQKQRVALARAIVNNPVLLLVDEPTGNLDTRTSLEIFELLLDYQSRRRATIVIVTHDPLVEKFRLPLMTLEEGRLVPHLGRV